MDMSYFAEMIDHCYDYAVEQRRCGRPVVGIMCEYTPRELIFAAGGVPVCLCGGSIETIAPAEEHLPANLCPLIKSTYGYHITKGNPFLEMADLVVAETTCDGKKKMYELMAQTRPMYVLELPQKPADPDALVHWTAELRKLRACLQDRFGRVISDDDIRQAIAMCNQYRRLRRELADLMAVDSPPLTGRDLLNANSSIWCMPGDIEQLGRAIASAATDTARSRRQDAIGAAPFRVLLTGVPMLHGASKALDITESSGGLVVCMENCSGLKPVIEDVDESAADPIDALARHYLRLPCSVMTRNDRRLELLEQLAGRFRADCIIDLSWQACLTYDVESYRVRELAGRLGLPYLRISTDYSPSDAARITLRVEALFETIRR